MEGEEAISFIWKSGSTKKKKAFKEYLHVK
jgi:hypothetical protein